MHATLTVVPAKCSKCRDNRRNVVNAKGFAVMGWHWHHLSTGRHHQPSFHCAQFHRVAYPVSRNLRKDFHKSHGMIPAEMFAPDEDLRTGSLLVVAAHAVHAAAHTLIVGGVETLAPALAAKDCGVALKLPVVLAGPS